MDRFFRYLRYAELIDDEEVMEAPLAHDEADPFRIMSDKVFFEEFRFSKINAMDLIERLTPHMPTRADKGLNVPLHQRILIGLQWLGTGNYYWNLRGITGCSKTTARRCVWDTIKAISSADMVREWVSWPSGENAKEHVAYFQEKYHLKNILGVVDGTHIPILAPTGDPFEPAYVNRKQFHSLNAQIVCGADYKVIHVDVSNVGSVHDARVWDESDVPALIQREKLSLLGDSAYPCRWYVLTPYDARFRNNLDANQQTFQRRLLAARQNVEQTIGILKQRFHVLRRPARYSLDNVPMVVVACCVLHNICRHYNIPANEDAFVAEDEIGEATGHHLVAPDAVGNAVRQEYINRYVL